MCSETHLIKSKKHLKIIFNNVKSKKYFSNIFKDFQIVFADVKQLPNAYPAAGPKSLIKKEIPKNVNY